MLIVTIPYVDGVSAGHLIDQAIMKGAEAIECRFDYAETLDFETIATIRQRSTLPLMFTLRKKSQGGFYPHNEQRRLDSLRMLIQLNPDYVDIEHDAPRDFLEALPLGVKYICSWHSFYETPSDLESILTSMRYPAFYAYKMAALANSAADAQRLIEFVQKNNHHCKLTVIGMGDHGRCTRLRSVEIGNWMHYMAVNSQHSTAPGQITIDDFIRRDTYI